jgi:hypothetical protein
MRSLVVRAEILMADAVDEGQANSEIKRVGDQLSEDRTIITDLGISRQRLHEFRQMRYAPPAQITPFHRQDGYRVGLAAILAAIWLIFLYRQRMKSPP